MRTIRPILLLAVIGLVLAACSGSSASLSQTNQDAGLEIPEALSGAGVGGVPSAAPAAPNPAASSGTEVAAIDDARIIRTGTMSLDVTNVASAVRAARDAVIGLGGYIGASTTSDDGDRPTAEITYRIPVGRWEQALDALRDLNGLTTRVAGEHTDAIEVTSQIVDLDARITNLRASEIALQAIAEQATKISDILDVQERLTETRGQIESLAAQRKDLSDRADYSSLTVDFSVPVVAVQVAADAWDPASVVDSASATTVSVLQGLATAGIWFAIVWLPIIVVLLIIVGIVIAVARRMGLGRQMPDSTPPSAPLAGPG